MGRASRRAAWAALFTLLAISTTVRADLPAPPSSASASAAPAASAPPREDTDATCDETTVAWAKRASARAGLEILATSCPKGLVHLQVVGAGCDFEISRERGFQRTSDGAFGVSPIVSLDWETAPAPMKKAFAALLTALAEDPTLPMGTGRSRPLKVLFGSQRNQIAAGVGLVVLLAAGFALGWKRRRAARAVP